MKKLFAAMTAALMVMAVAGTALAAPPTPDLTTQAWRIQYIMPATSSLWDINKVKRSTDGDLSFPVQTFLTKGTGSFAVYFQNNYNAGLTETQTLTASAFWTAGTYETRSTVFSGAYGRFWFQSAIGNYNSNDYWWYSGDSLDLNSESVGTTMIANLGDRALWTNLCGQSATDTTAHPGPNCVGGIDPAVSPHDGFTNALANVKQLGISFGSAGSYASGIAFVGETGTFTVSDFTVTPTP
jgi:hypothetical protein